MRRPPIRLSYCAIVRNCVVHAAGMVDQRTLDAVSAHLSGLTLGAAIDFDDRFLFRLIEAMWHHVQDIDVLVRHQR